MRRQIETGWPAIAVLVLLIGAGLGCWLITSGDSPEQFYSRWYFLVWAAGALIGLCILAELFRLKCPNCRSRAIRLLAEEEIDRWIGQKQVTENTVSAGAFKSIGDPKFKGVNGGVAFTQRTIPVTKRRMLQKLCCRTCGYEFSRNLIEEMT